MKITTNNTLNKLIQLLKSKIDSLTTSITNIINDNSSSTSTVYSSSKVDELLASSGSHSKPILIASSLSFTAWEEVSAENDTYYQAKINLSTSEDYSSKIALVDLDTSAIADTLVSIEMYINEYSKITQAHIEWVGTAQTRAPSPSPDTGCFVIFQAKEKPDANLYFLTLLADKDDIVPIDFNEDELNGRVMLTNRAPVSSGGSTIYEFITPKTLSSFTANSDENIPYYADVTDLSSYITDTNKVAVIIPDTSETNASLLKYTEVISGGVIRCYFTEQPTSYTIKAIEIRNANLVSVTPLISFTIGDTLYQAEEGMRFNQFVYSKYNTLGLTISSGGNYIIFSDSGLYLLEPDRYGGSIPVNPDSTINDGDIFTISSNPIS